MEIVMKDHQKECLRQIEERLKAGERYLSVAMSTGVGKTATSLFLAKKFSAEQTAMVFRYRLTREQAEDAALKLGVQNTDFYNVQRFVDSADEYPYVILLDLDAVDRRQVESKLKGTGTRAISFFTIGQEISAGSVDRPPEPETETVKIPQDPDPVVCVYATKEVLDVRDVRYAGKEERDYFINGNTIIVNNLRSAIEQERRRAARLQFYLSSLDKMHDKQRIEEQAAEIERLKEEQKLKDLAAEAEKKAAEAEIEKLRAELRERDLMIAQQQQMLEFTSAVVSGIGIEEDVMQDSFSQIQDARESLKDRLESDDEDVREAALKQFQDMTSEIVNRLIQSVLPAGDMEHFEEYLKGVLTEEVWQRLDGKSRDFLITAKSTYESMMQKKDSKDYDYSGVCLLVTKALEVEAAKRFFYKYKEYLSRRYDSVTAWPYVLRQRDRGQITDLVIEDSDFTLGSVVPVMGFRRCYDSSGSITGYDVSHYPTRDEFVSFAMTDLFKFSERSRVESEIEKDYLFIEKVRLDYRNPSAHRGRLTRTSAQNCMEYVIDVHHMLREMLKTMKI